MNDPIRILVLEDLGTEIEPAKQEILNSVGKCTFSQVETRREFLDALGSLEPDLILSGPGPSAFGGREAVGLAREHAPLTPVIIWNGHPGEDTAVDFMKAGAVNYVSWENLKRLGPAVVQALEERRQLISRRQTELRYEAVFEQSHDAIFILDLKGGILAVNHCASDLLGYSSDGLLGLSVLAISAEARQIETALKRLIDGELLSPFESQFVMKNGGFVPVEVNAELVFDDNGRAAHIQAFVRNITDRRRTEIEIQKRNDDLGVLNAINEAAIRGDGMEAIMNLLAEEMKRILSIAGCSFYLLGPDGNSLTMKQYHMTSKIMRRIEGLIGGTIPLVQVSIREGGYFQRALNSDSGMILTDPAGIQAWMEEFTETAFLPPAAKAAVRKLIPQIYRVLNIKSAMIVPLVLNGRTIGLLDASSPGQFTTDELQRVENISRQLTAAILRQEANERIEKSENFLRSVQNALSASIAILDEKGTIVRVNAAWRKFGEQNGFTHPEHGVGMNYLEVCDSVRGENAAEAQTVGTAIREVISGARKEAWFEYAGHSPTEKRWFVLRITKFEDAERTWVVIAHENITERKLAEQALHESEDRYRGLFENTPIAIWEEDFSEVKKHLDSLKQKGVSDLRAYFTSHPEEMIRCRRMVRIVDVNRAALEMYETEDKAELIRISMEEFSKGELENLLEDLVAVAEDKTSHGWVGADETLGGRPLQISLQRSVAPGHEKDYAKVIVTTVDVTDRERAEKNLKSREAIISAVAYSAQQFIDATDWQGVIPDILAKLGQATNVSRVYIFQNHIATDHKLLASQRFEWTASDIEPQIGNPDLQNVSFKDAGFSRWVDLFENNSPVYGNVRDLPPDEQELLSPQNILSIVIVPIYVKDQWWGFIGFDDCGSERDWDETEINALKTAAGNLGSAIQRHEAEKALHESEARFRGLFENTPIAIWEEDFSEVKKYLDALKQRGVADFREYFVSDPEEVAFCNRKIRVLNVNETAVQMFEAGSKEALLDYTNANTSQAEQEHNHEDFVAIAEGRTSNSWEGVDTKLTGEPLEIGLNWSVVPGHEDDYSRVIVTTTDITERKKAEHDRLERLKEMTCLYAVRHDMGLELSVQELCRRIVEHLTHAMQFPEITVPVLELDGRRYSTGNYSEDLSHCLSADVVVRGNPHGHLRVYYMEDKPFVLPEEQDLIRSIADDLRLWLERRQAEESLRASEERYRSLFDRMLDGVYRSTHNGRFVDVNHAMVKMFGFSDREEMLAVDIKKDLYFSPEERGSHLLDTGQEEVDVYRMRRKDGSEIWVEDHGSYVHDEQGNIIYHEGILRDVTDRIRREEELRQSETRYRTVVENQTEFIVRWQADGKRSFVNEAYCRYFGITQDQALSSGFMSLVYEEDRPLVEGKIARLLSGQSRSETDEHRVIKPDGEIGWQEWTDHAILDTNGSIIEFQSVGRDITDRKQAEDALQEAEFKYRNLVERLPVIVYTAEMGMNGRWTYVSPQIETLLGFTPDEWMADESLWFRQMNPSDRDRHQQEEELAWSRGEAFDAEYRLYRKDGSEIWIRDVGVIFPSPDGGAPIVQGTLIDVTDRKRAEEELKRSNSLLHSTLEATKDGILVVGRDRKVSSFNRKFLELWKIPYSLVKQRDDLALQEYLQGQLKDAPGNLSRVDELYRLSEADSFEELELQDGRILERFTQPQRLGSEIMGRVWSYRDITERKRAEQELRESEERFRQLADNIQEMFWMKDVVNNKDEYFSPAFREIWGVQPELMIDGKISIFDTVLPADRPAVASAVEKQKQGERTEIEYRIKHPDGSVHWVWDRAFPIIDESGSVVRVAGITADITERKQAQEELRESEQRVQNIVRHSTSMFYSHTADHVLTYVSPQSRQILGCEPKEAMRRWQEWLSDHPANQDGIESTERAIRTGERQPPYELELITNDSRRIWVRVDESPLVENGETVAIVGSITDITDRKMTEEQLRKLSRAVEQSASTIVITDLKGNIEYVNPRFTETTGYTAEEVLGQNPRILKSGHTPPEAYESMWEVITTGRDWQGEFLNRKKNGELYWESVMMSPILNERGVTTHYIAVKEDVTDRKLAERNIQRHLTELEALYENGLAVGQLLQPQEIGERIIDTFSRHLMWHHVAIRLLKNGSDVLELIAFSLPHERGNDRDAAAANLVSRVGRVGQGITGWVVQTGEAVRTGNVQEYPQYVGTYDGIHSGLYMPLKIGERVLGVISVESEEPDAFSTQDERLLATLANQAAVAFENARLYQSVQQELVEREKAQKALRTSETHYRELANSITDVFFELDRDLRFTHWNKASEDLTGVAAEDAISRSMTDIFDDSAEQMRMREIYTKVLATRHPQTFETTFLRDLERRLFEVNAYPSTRGISVMAKEVTARKRSETIQRKRFELMEYSARHSLEEVARKTLDEISELTGSEMGFFHFMEEDEKTIGLQVWSTNALHKSEVPLSEGEHLHVDHAGVWAEAVRRRRSLIQNDYEGLPNRKELPPGHVNFTRQMLIPIIRNERIMAVMAVAGNPQEYAQQDLDLAMQFTDYAWDIIERKQMETALASERNLLAQRVEERTAELRSSNSNLARALRVKDEFLANMSHELRTPLNAVLGLSESLSEQVAGPLNEKQLKYVTTISESGHHLLSLINDILDLAKIEAGQVKLDINKVDVNSVCQASLRMIKQMAQKKNQEVTLDIAPELGLIRADERRLKQMVVNLLSNAVKFTQERGRLGLEVRGSEEDNKVIFTVWDEGIGIKEADLARLFQPFTQLDAGLARETSGTGLGLALVAQMARLHGGGVRVESEPGKGSRFTIVLPWEPAVPVDLQEKIRQTGKLSASRPEQGNRKKVLLIEDTREVVMLIQDYLEMEGYTVVAAQDGLDGITQAKLTNPDLILMDLQMPRMDGLEAARRLRSEPGFKNTPIIAVTALAMPNDRERCLAAGMNEYITKPVNLKALVKTIEKCLSTSEEKARPNEHHLDR